MHTKLLKVVREIDRMFGRIAAVNLVSVLRGETRRFVGLDGPSVRAYCEFRGIL